MPNPSYAWKRFWCPRESEIHLGYDGYLPDPESDWARNLNPQVKAFDAIAGVPCLALLGEPGIGKSRAMQTEKEGIDAKVRSEGDQTLWVDLRTYSSDSRLVQGLFENPIFISWRKADYRLHLFLDSLDECLLRVETVAALLAEELKKYPHERLFLRIACRTADWPNILESSLKEIWGQDSMQVYELAPLRRRDVMEAASIERLDADSFLREIEHREVVPLAIKPVTLAFLLNKYRKDAQLPTKQVELYDSGCRLLCEETNESRIASRATGNLSADQRLAVASRIAATTVFANRYAIWSSVDYGNIPEEDVAIAELCGGFETARGIRFEITESVIHETLDTGLFTTRGPNRFGWAHQTYAEFLAAQYLTQLNMPLAQVMNLLLYPGESDKRLVPQLNATAAWLGSLRADVFREVVKFEPEMLLQSDVAAAELNDRADLVQALLDGYQSEQLIDWDWDLRRLYRKLAHPRLAEQIRPYISDRTKGIMVRRVATDIAESCELHEVENDLLSLALDSAEALPTRENAAYAICQIGSSEAKAKLKTLTRGQSDSDPNDVLKGCGLLAVWPEHLTAHELFDRLTPPQNESLYGAYQQFLSSGFSEKIEPADLPLAINWATKMHVEHKISYHLEEPIDAILLRAWQYLDSPGVLDAFTRFALAQFWQHKGLTGGDYPHGHNESQLIAAISSEDNKRQQFLISVLPHIESKDAVFLLAQLGPRLVTAADVSWMIKYGLAANSPAIKSSLAHLISWVFDRDSLPQIETIFLASQQDPTFAAEFARYFNPITIDSPEAREMKSWDLEMKKWQQPQDKPLIVPPPAERIAKCLVSIESGDTEKWWSLCMEMTLEPTSAYYGNEAEPDLHKLPGWIASDTVTQAKIVEAAKRYVLERDAEPDQWVGQNIFYRPAAAGYKALYLLIEEDLEFLSTLPVKYWRNWVPIIAAYPSEFGELKDVHSHHALLKMAYSYVPDEVINVMMKLVDKENAALDNIFAIRTFEECWDTRFASALLAKATDKKLKPTCMGDLLQALLKHGSGEARIFAEALITSPLPAEGEERTRAFTAAYALLTCALDAGWSVVWPAIQQDTQFGQKVFEAAAYNDRVTVNVWPKLNETLLADLYIWLVRQYPFEDDPQIHEFHSVSLREQIAHWRDMLLNYLQGRGTREACDAIQKIAVEFPTRLHIKRSLLEAQSLLRRRTWLPISPSDILNLAHDNAARYIQNGQQLLEVLIESLRRFERKLHDETPAAINLWDEISKGVYRPRDENRLSDAIKRHLDEDLRQRGIVISREVEIRRGEETDIHVDAVVRTSKHDDSDLISAIIETKGCWHRELNGAMETQLVNRYLRENSRCQNGIYLVGWFSCEQWDKNDYRQTQVPSLTVTQAQEQFDKQATALSGQDIMVRAVVIDTALR